MTALRQWCYAHLLESSAEAARARLDALSARLGQDSATSDSEEGV